VDSGKSYNDPLERGRASGFLLGLVVVLSTLLVLLELTTRDSSYDAEADAIEDLSQDVEIMPFLQRKDMIAAVTQKTRPAITERVRAVENDVEESSRDERDEEETADTKGNAEGETSAESSTADKTEETTTALSPVAVDENDNPLDFHVVERLPEFPGGMVEFMKWLTKNLRYPPLAQQQKMQGKVLVAFIINKDGTISSPKVVTSGGQEFDREALRVIRMMPKWAPGEDHGKPCRTYFRIPIVFKL